MKKSQIRITFGQNVRLRRHKLGMTLKELAKVADLHHSYIGSVERGERNIRFENIITLAKALKCHAKDLMPT
jgi:transcriptional regulator with XRE-family HTH domain